MPTETKTNPSRGRKQRSTRSRDTYPLGKTFNWSTRYVDVRNRLLPPASLALASHVYFLNGMYDPDYTGTGHQPLGFDQFVGTMYDHYVVTHVHAKITFTNLSDTIPAHILLSIKDTGTVSTDIVNIMENGRNQYAVLGVRGSATGTRILLIDVDTSRFFGKDVTLDDTYEGNAGNNPSDGVFLHISTQQVTGGTPESVDFTTELTIRSILTEPRLLTSS